MTVSEQQLRAKTAAFVNESLVSTYLSSVNHFKNTDLVLFYVEDDDPPLLCAVPRVEVLDRGNDGGLSARTLEKLRRPARETAKVLTRSTVAFWLIAFFSGADGESDGDAVCTAVVVERMLPEGDA